MAASASTSPLHGLSWTGCGGANSSLARKMLRWGVMTGCPLNALSSATGGGGVSGSLTRAELLLGTMTGWDVNGPPAVGRGGGNSSLICEELRFGTLVQSMLRPR